MTHSSPGTYDQQVSDLGEMEPVAWRYQPFDGLYFYRDDTRSPADAEPLYPASAIERLQAELSLANKTSDLQQVALASVRQERDEALEELGKVIMAVAPGMRQSPASAGVRAMRAERDSLAARVEEIRRETLEEAAKLIEETQEATSLRTNKRSLVERSEGNLVGLAYAEHLRALKEKA